ncbi:hypothetical protein Tcan_10532 [Toxocara canis]|uniref:G-protein coupled receptors family 1 profile domain-containing protein n=1 Tax=Toxocara canis TaxID=6265 RepID=A0A0B2UY07_TOXCA|nr:hypothetical protein Tcan_10532 [Toxocara canis]
MFNFGPSANVSDYAPHAMIIRSDLFISFGVIAIIANVIVITVISSNSDLRTKMILMNFLAVGELINGLAFVAIGVGRLILLWRGTLYLASTSKVCMFTKPWPALLVVAGQLPAFVNLMLAIEAFIATKWFQLYRNCWNYRYKRSLGLVATFMSGMGLVLAFAASAISERPLVDSVCAVLKSTGIIYGTIHYSLIILVYAISFALLLYVLVITRQCQGKTVIYKRRNRILMLITGTSLVFVALPSFILIFNEWRVLRVSSLIRGIIYCLDALRSALNLPVYVMLRSDFRYQLMKPLNIILRHTTPKTNKITPFFTMASASRAFV